MIIIGGHQGFALNRSRKSSALVHLGDTLSITAGGYKNKTRTAEHNNDTGNEGFCQSEDADIKNHNLIIT